MAVSLVAWGVIGSKIHGEEPKPEDRTWSRGAMLAGVPVASSSEDPAGPVFVAIAAFHAAPAAYTGARHSAQAKIV
jgi:hypothetical protein